MSKDSVDPMRTYAWIGLGLLCVQMAEQSLQSAIQTVLDDEDVRLAEQSEPERKQTLGDFLKRLKKRVKLPVHFKEELYTFLRVRNQLVHEFDFKLGTDEGRKASNLFIQELAFRAISISGLMMTVFQVCARDEYDEEFYDKRFFPEMENEHMQQMLKFFEQHHGGLAREILAGRNKVLSKTKTRVRSR